MLQAFLVLPGFAAAYLVAGRRRMRRRVVDLLAAAAAVVVSGGWYLLLVELWPADARPYIGGSQHDSIVELALGYNGFGRLTGDETGRARQPQLRRRLGPAVRQRDGSGHRVAAARRGDLPGRRGSSSPGAHRARIRARAALILWGGWLVVTAVVFSFANGIVHPYYTVALAPAIGASIGIGATLLWRNRSDIRAATALSGTVAGHRHPRGGAAVPAQRVDAVAAGDGRRRGSGRGRAAAGRRAAARAVARSVAALAVAACLAAPAAYSVATAADSRTAARSRRSARRAMASAGFTGPGGLLDSPSPGPALAATLSADAHDYTWAAAVVGSNNAAGYQLASGAPVMAVGGFNGTDPSPTLEEFQRYVADRQIHYFIRGKMMIGHWGGADDRQPRVRRHRRVGGDALHPADRRPRGHLRPHAAAEELIAAGIASAQRGTQAAARPWMS